MCVCVCLLLAACQGDEMQSHAYYVERAADGSAVNQFFAGDFLMDRNDTQALHYLKLSAAQVWRAAALLVLLVLCCCWCCWQGWCCSSFIGRIGCAFA